MGRSHVRVWYGDCVPGACGPHGRAEDVAMVVIAVVVLGLLAVLAWTTRG